MTDQIKPKLYYFDGPGLAEITRVLLTHVGIEFEDIRFEGDIWLNKYKPMSPLGTAPFYHEGDIEIGSSLAIARYVAEKNELGGNSPFENAQLASYVDAMAPIIPDVYLIVFGSEEQREERKAKFVAETPSRLAAVESQIRSEKHFLSGDRLSWADFMASVCAYQITNHGFGSLLEGVPKFNVLTANIDSMDRIREWRLKTHKVS